MAGSHLPPKKPDLGVKKGLVSIFANHPPLRIYERFPDTILPPVRHSPNRASQGGDHSHPTVSRPCGESESLLMGVLRCE
jgi:hypothetical protein